MRTGSRGSAKLSELTVYLHGRMDYFKCSINEESHYGSVNAQILENWRLGKVSHCQQCFPYTTSGRKIMTGSLIPDIDLYNSKPSIRRSDLIGEFLLEDETGIHCLLVIGTSLR